LIVGGGSGGFGGAAGGVDAFSGSQNENLGR